MRLLLDTHILLWWLADDARLGTGIRATIADGRNDVLVSSISIAEIAIKRLIGKLDAPADLLGSLAHEGFDELPLLSTHAARLSDLPMHHRDPFDRLLVCQALAEQLVIASHDPAFESYGVAVLSD